VAEVEQAGGGAHALDLVEDRSVLHRHVPAAELDQLGAGAGVDVVQGSRFHEGRETLVDRGEAAKAGAARRGASRPTAARSTG
jgi:hypothetical protein